MIIDIFQYSNVYVLRKSMQWLADAHHVKEECGPYVTKPSMQANQYGSITPLNSSVQIVRSHIGPNYCIYILGSNQEKPCWSGWKNTMLSMWE